MRIRVVSLNVQRTSVPAPPGEGARGRILPSHRLSAACRPGTYGGIGLAPTVIVNRAYSSRMIRSHLRERDIRAVIPQPVDQVRNRLRRGRGDAGRPAGGSTGRASSGAGHLLGRIRLPSNHVNIRAT